MRSGRLCREPARLCGGSSAWRAAWTGSPDARGRSGDGSRLVASRPAPWWSCRSRSARWKARTARARTRNSGYRRVPFLGFDDGAGVGCSTGPASSTAPGSTSYPSVTSAIEIVVFTQSRPGSPSSVFPINSSFGSTAVTGKRRGRLTVCEWAGPGVLNRSGSIMLPGCDGSRRADQGDLQPALICRRGTRRSLTCGLQAGECQARLRLSGLSRRADWLRQCLFPDLSAAGSPWRGRRTLTSVGPVAVLLLLGDRRDDCPHRAC